MLPPIQHFQPDRVDSRRTLRRRRSQSFDTAMLCDLPDGHKHLEALNNIQNGDQKIHGQSGFNATLAPRVIKRIKVIHKKSTRVTGGVLQQIYQHIEVDNSKLATKDRVQQHLNKNTEDWVNDHMASNQGQGDNEGQTVSSKYRQIVVVQGKVPRSRPSLSNSRMSIATSSLVVPSTADSSRVSIDLSLEVLVALKISFIIRKSYMFKSSKLMTF